MKWLIDCFLMTYILVFVFKFFKLTTFPKLHITEIINFGDQISRLKIDGLIDAFKWFDPSSLNDSYQIIKICGN